MVWESLVLAVNSVWDILALHCVCELLTTLRGSQMLLPHSHSRAQCWDKWHWSCTQTAEGRMALIKVLGGKYLGPAFCLCSSRAAYTGSVFSALLCTFYQQPELPVCPLLGVQPTQIPVFRAGGLCTPFSKSICVTAQEKNSVRENSKAFRCHTNTEAGCSEGFCVRLCINQSKIFFILLALVGSMYKQRFRSIRSLAESSITQLFPFLPPEHFWAHALLSASPMVVVTPLQIAGQSTLVSLHNAQVEKTILTFVSNCGTL